MSVLEEKFGVFSGRRYYDNFVPTRPQKIIFFHADSEDPSKSGCFLAGSITFHEPITLQGDQTVNCRKCGSAVCDVYTYRNELQTGFDSAVQQAPLDSILKRSVIRKQMYLSFVQAKYGFTSDKSKQLVGECVRGAIYGMAPNPNQEPYDSNDLFGEE